MLLYYYFSTFLIEVVLSPQLDTHQAALIGPVSVSAFILLPLSATIAGIVERLLESRAGIQLVNYI